MKEISECTHQVARGMRIIEYNGISQESYTNKKIESLEKLSVDVNWNNRTGNQSTKHRLKSVWFAVLRNRKTVCRTSEVRTTTFSRVPGGLVLADNSSFRKVQG